MPLSSRTEKDIAGKANKVIDYVEVLDSHGGWKKVEGINTLVKSLRNLFLTPLRTYIFDPSYGSLLHHKIFEIYDEQTKEDIIFEVRDRIALFDPRVIIKDVSVEYFQNSKGFYISAILEKGDYEGQLELEFAEKNMDFSIHLDAEEKR